MRPGTRCRDFLASKVDVTEVQRALAAQRPYDGTRSTLTVEEAGLVSPTFAFDPTTRKIADQRVYEWMEGNRALTAMNNPATRYETYFNPRKMTANTLIHEALHSATLLHDTDLAQRLTGKVFTDGRKASLAISDVLALNGCGKVLE